MASTNGDASSRQRHRCAPTGCCAGTLCADNAVVLVSPIPLTYVTAVCEPPAAERLAAEMPFGPGVSCALPLPLTGLNIARLQDIAFLTGP